MSQFKRRKVVMLPTNEKAIPTLLFNPSTNKIKLNSKELFTVKDFNDCGYECFELYITSDEKIKEGDWCIINLGENSRAVKVKSLKGNHPIFNVDIEDGYAGLKSLKKIIATTDGSIGLPQPSQSFIEKYVDQYNKGNNITDVLVEYEIRIEWYPSEIIGTAPSGSTTRISGNKWLGDFPKVNPKDNTITIKKVKDSWCREEVENLIRLAMQSKGYTPEYKVKEFCDQHL